MVIQPPKTSGSLEQLTDFGCTDATAHARANEWGEGEAGSHAREVSPRYWIHRRHGPTQKIGELVLRDLQRRRERRPKARLRCRLAGLPANDSGPFHTEAGCQLFLAYAHCPAAACEQWTRKMPHADAPFLLCYGSTTCGYVDATGGTEQAMVIARHHPDRDEAVCSRMMNERKCSASRVVDSPFAVFDRSIDFVEHHAVRRSASSELAPTREQELQLAGQIGPNWQARADCRSAIDDTWFPSSSQPTHRAAAVARCVPCPVRRSCLSFALLQGEIDGVWGGTTDMQRRALFIDLSNGVSVKDVLDSATIKPAYLWRPPVDEA